jgi:arsenate reductase
MSPITIYHNPACGTSRNTLAMIRNSGAEPEVIEYLKTPPSKERLAALVAAMGMPVRDLLRRKGTPYDELGLDDPKWTDDQLLELMVQHLLPSPQQGAFTKEDGEAVIDAQGQRVAKG